MLLAFFVVGCQEQGVILPPIPDDNAHYLNVKNFPETAVFNISCVTDNYTYTVDPGRYWMDKGGSAGCEG